MKTLPLLLILFGLFITRIESQINCVRCYNQNERISPLASNYIRNGSFELTDCTAALFTSVWCPNSNNYACDLADWTCTGGGENSYPYVFDNTLSIIPDGNNAAYFGNGNAFTCSDTWGDFSCETFKECTLTGFPNGYPKSLPGYGESAGVSLSQTVSDLTVGEAYILEFWAGGEPLHNLLSQNGIFAINLGFGNTYLECKVTGEPDHPIGTRYLIEFNATAVNQTITFTNWGHICDLCTELVIDDVLLYDATELNPEIPPCVAGTGDPYYQPVDVFPNPFHDQLNIFTPFVATGTFYLYNSLSEEILRSPVENEQHIATAFLAPGIYFYSIIDKNSVLKSGKLVRY